MKCVLKIFDGLDVTESTIDTSKSNVYVDSSKMIQLSLFDSSGNEFLTVVTPLNN